MHGVPLLILEMASRSTIDKRSWLIVIVVGLVAVGTSLILLFLPYFTGTSKSSATTVPTPNPAPLDILYWERQNGTFKDSLGNVYTGTVQYIHTRDGNWDVRLWGDDQSGGICCDVRINNIRRATVPARQYLAIIPINALSCCFFLRYSNLPGLPFGHYGQVKLTCRWDFAIIYVFISDLMDVYWESIGSVGKS